MPSNFKNAKIYCIKSYNTDKIYIGSTCRPLSQRFSEHKSHYKSGKLKSNSKYIFDYGNTYIELLKETPCNNIMELRKYEHYYIRNMECVNKYIPTRNKYDYYEDNKEKLKKKSYDRYHSKKKIINQKHSEIKYNCVCGSILRKCAKARHEKSNKHKFFVFNLHNELNHL